MTEIEGQRQLGPERPGALSDGSMAAIVPSNFAGSRIARYSVTSTHPASTR